MLEARRRFSALLDAKNGEIARANSERQEFEALCEQNFALLINSIQGMADEVRDRKIGEISAANVTPSSDRYEIIYRFEPKGVMSLFVTLRFDRRHDPNKVEIQLGSTWASKDDARTFTVEQMEKAIAYIESAGVELFAID